MNKAVITVPQIALMEAQIPCGIPRPWQPVATLFPHQITLQLSTSYIVTGLRYLPRQDGNKNGIITSYAVYVSPDGIGWDFPSLRDLVKNSALKEVKFVGKQGRYVAWRQTGRENQSPYTSAAGMNLLRYPAANRASQNICYRKKSCVGR